MKLRKFEITVTEDYGKPPSEIAIRCAIEDCCGVDVEVIEVTEEEGKK